MPPLIPGTDPYYTVEIIVQCLCFGGLYFIVRQLIHWVREPEWEED